MLFLFVGDETVEQSGNSSAGSCSIDTTSPTWSLWRNVLVAESHFHTFSPIFPVGLEFGRVWKCIVYKSHYSVMHGNILTQLNLICDVCLLIRFRYGSLEGMIEC